MEIKHKFQSAKGDGPDSTRVRPSDWNDEHDVVASGGGGVVIGRTDAGPGPMSEISINALLPAGVMLPYAGSAAPTGWLLCYGQAVSRTTYATLFAAIGTSYGAGDGATTFNIPDLRGTPPVGKTNMGGSDRGNLSGGGALGAYLGAQSVSAPVSVGVSGSISGSTGGSLGLSGTGHVQVNSGNANTGQGNGFAYTRGGDQVVVTSGSTSGSLGVGGSFSGAGTGTASTTVVQPSTITNYIINTGV